VIATEDRSFWTNDGIDLGGVFRAFVTNVVSGRIEGQTDTMPLRVQKLWEGSDNPAAFALASVLTMLALVTLFGLGIVEATGRTKLLNFTSNIAALLIFALGGKIMWMAGLVMGLAQFIGAQLGARLAIKNGAKIIRPLLVVVCCAMAVKLLADPTNPLRALFP